MNETYTTSKGYTLTFVPIAMLLAKVRQSIPMPEPPTYSYPAFGGVTVTKPHNESTLQNDEDRAKWEAYQRCLDEAQVKVNRAITRTMLLEGIVVDKEPTPGWIERQKALGIQVPDDPIEQRLHWIESVVIGTPTDLTEISLGVMKASDTPEEVLASVAASFRRAMGKPDGNAPVPAISTGGQVVDEPQVRTSQGGNPQRSHGKEVRRARR